MQRRGVRKTELRNAVLDTRLVLKVKTFPREEKTKTTYPDAVFEASASCPASVVMMGFRSFFLFLAAFPLEVLAAAVTCFAFWIAACFNCDPFMVCRQRGVVGEICWGGALNAIPLSGVFREI